MLAVRNYRNLSHSPDKPYAYGLGPVSTAGALPRMFNQHEHHAGRRAIGGQFVRLSANSIRLERRSADGQMILTAGLASWKPASDLPVVEPPYGIEP